MPWDDDSQSTPQESGNSEIPKITKKQVNKLIVEGQKRDLSQGAINSAVKSCGFDKMEDITEDMFDEVLIVIQSTTEL